MTIPNTVADSVTLVESVFENDGHESRSRSTGFWFYRPGDTEASLFLCRHAVDPKLAFFDHPEGWTLKTVILHQRKGDKLGALPGSHRLEVLNIPECLVLHPSADCAVLQTPQFEKEAAALRLPCAVDTDTFADAAFLRTSLLLGSGATFVGYPSENGIKLYNERTLGPIARVCTIATDTSYAFSHPLIHTTDAILTAGLSFGGASGSIVLSHGRQEVVSYGSVSNHVLNTRPRVIGIMSGHMYSNRSYDKLAHLGLSWFTRSSAMLSLVNSPWPGDAAA